MIRRLSSIEAGLLGFRGDDGDLQLVPCNRSIGLGRQLDLFPRFPPLQCPRPAGGVPRAARLVVRGPGTSRNSCVEVRHAAWCWFKWCDIGHSARLARKVHKKRGNHGIVRGLGRFYLGFNLQPVLAVLLVNLDVQKAEAHVGEREVEAALQVAAAGRREVNSSIITRMGFLPNCQDVGGRPERLQPASRLIEDEGRLAGEPPAQKVIGKARVQALRRGPGGDLLATRIVFGIIQMHCETGGAALEAVEVRVVDRVALCQSTIVLAPGMNGTPREHAQRKLRAQTPAMAPAEFEGQTMLVRGGLVVTAARDASAFARHGNQQRRQGGGKLEGSARQLGGASLNVTVIVHADLRCRGALAVLASAATSISRMSSSAAPLPC
jgi:hypothetical protein